MAIAHLQPQKLHSATHERLFDGLILSQVLFRVNLFVRRNINFCLIIRWKQSCAYLPRLLETSIFKLFMMFLRKRLLFWQGFGYNRTD